MPFPDEIGMGTEVHEKKPRFDEEPLPIQCPDCGQWVSSDDLNEDGTCYLCEEDCEEAHEQDKR
jgi:Zn finger protein HypA/HybF involved in hydrogenase expression